MKSLKVMAKDELAIIPFITHKLPIVLKISDRVTVLRRGKVVARLRTKDATMQSLARSMVGRDVAFKVKKLKVKTGRQILKVENLSALSDKGVLALRGVSFSVCEGEIFGIAGIAGNGQHELAEALMGLRKMKMGEVTFEDKDITNSSILERWKMGLAYIPPERVEVGTVGGFSLVDNVALNFYFEPEFSRRGILDYKKIRKHTEKAISEFGVVCPNADCQAKNLSGGNLQKLILARVVSRRPRLLIANLPTHGLDVGATEFVCNELMELKKDMTGIVFISEDLDEVLAMSDRIAPIYEGRFVDIIPAEKAKKEDTGAMIAGVHLKG
ncbi:Galactose/methyl galactoside import ATP-binding protein MglA [subsurface metagenome]